MKKYELTNETKVCFGRTLYRIKALINFGDVKADELGGFIESVENLSHESTAWVGGNAKVYGDAEVYEDAGVCGDAKVYSNAEVYGKAWVYGNAEVHDNARIYDDAEVCGNARVYGNAEVYDNALVSGNAEVCDSAWVYGKAEVYGNAEVCDSAWVSGDARVYDNADYLCFKGLGSQNRNTTFFKCEDHIHVTCGCFSDDLAAFEEKVKETHGDNKYAKEYLACLEVVKIHFETQK